MGFYIANTFELGRLWPGSVAGGRRESAGRVVAVAVAAEVVVHSPERLPRRTTCNPADAGQWSFCIAPSGIAFRQRSAA
jgi:hypothetical protein